MFNEHTPCLDLCRVLGEQWGPRQSQFDLQELIFWWGDSARACILVAERE